MLFVSEGLVGSFSVEFSSIIKAVRQHRKGRGLPFGM